MGAGEKKSSPDSTNDISQVQQTDIRLHHFPDIPVGDLSKGRRCASLEERFQHSNFQNVDSACENMFSSFNKKKIFQKKKSLSIAEIAAEAYQKGFIDGEKKGIVDGEKSGFDSSLKKIEPVLNSLQEALLLLKKIRKETYECIEKEVAELALAIAKKVICQEVKTDKQVVVCIAREALTKVKESGQIKIKMSPSDLQFINETKYQLSNLIENIDNVTFDAEESIASGGCIIETDLGEIDARIEKQLQVVEESFRSEIEKSNLEA